MVSGQEKAKKLKASQAKKSEYGDSSKYVSFTTTDKKGEKTDGKIKVEINAEKVENDKKLAGYNMIVTSEINMADSEIYSAYHSLWRIEESANFGLNVTTLFSFNFTVFFFPFLSAI